MTTVAFWTVALLTAAKTSREIRVPAPFEWVGELAAGILAMLVAFLAAYALTLAIGYDEPWPTHSFKATNVAPPSTGVWA